MHYNKTSNKERSRPTFDDGFPERGPQRAAVLLDVAGVRFGKERVDVAQPHAMEVVGGAIGRLHTTAITKAHTHTTRNQTQILKKRGGRQSAQTWRVGTTLGKVLEERSFFKCLLGRLSSAPRLCNRPHNKAQVRIGRARQRWMHRWVGRQRGRIGLKKD